MISNAAPWNLKVSFRTETKADVHIRTSADSGVVEFLPAYRIVQGVLVALRTFERIASCTNVSTRVAVALFVTGSYYAVESNIQLYEVCVHICNLLSHRSPVPQHFAMVHKRVKGYVYKRKCIGLSLLGALGAALNVRCCALVYRKMRNVLIERRFRLP
jgi:hypothetical protein